MNDPDQVLQQLEHIALRHQYSGSATAPEIPDALLTGAIAVIREHVKLRQRIREAFDIKIGDAIKVTTG